MDDLTPKGLVEESVLDNDRVFHTETASKGFEENTVKVNETHRHAETRDEKSDFPDNDTLEEEERKKSTLRENVQSVTGVFAAVAATAVFAVAVAFSNAPVVNIKSFDIGQNYVEYKADITNETGDNLIITISENDKAAYEKEVTAGEITELVNSLEPDTRYSFTVRSAGGLKRTYISKSFQTTRDPTEYEPKVHEFSTRRGEGDGTLYLKFNVSDINSYYSRYKLILKSGGSVTAEIPVSDISSEIPISLTEFTLSEYQLELTAATSMPRDIKKNITTKVIYSAVLKN